MTKWSNVLYCIGTLSRSNWDLEMLVFEERGKPEDVEKNAQSRDKNQQQTQTTYNAMSGNRTWATFVGDECYHHCAIPAVFNVLPTVLFSSLFVILGYICQIFSWGLQFLAEGNNIAALIFPLLLCALFNDKNRSLAHNFFFLQMSHKKVKRSLDCLQLFCMWLLRSYAKHSNYWHFCL